MPSELLMVVRVKLVSTSVAVILAPGTTAPERIGDGAANCTQTLSSRRCREEHTHQKTHLSSAAHLASRLNLFSYNSHKKYKPQGRPRKVRPTWWRSLSEHRFPCQGQPALAHLPGHRNHQRRVFRRPDSPSRRKLICFS